MSVSIVLILLSADQNPAMWQNNFLTYEYHPNMRQDRIYIKIKKNYLEIAAFLDSIPKYGFHTHHMWLWQNHT